MNKISQVGIVSGFIFSILSALRYFVMFPDTDRAIVYIIIGCLIMFVSYEHGKRIKLENTLYDVEVYLQDLKSK